MVQKAQTTTWNVKKNLQTVVDKLQESRNSNWSFTPANGSKSTLGFSSGSAFSFAKKTTCFSVWIYIISAKQK